MKTGSNVVPPTEAGFWARLANAFRAHETSLESRIARLEKQVAQLIGAGERLGTHASRRNDAA